MQTTSFTTFDEANSFILTLINKKNQLFPGDFGTQRTKVFLELIGNPQEKLRVIHLAGTSGKGSTAYLTSVLLISQGFKTGLHVSPHLLDIRERFQINNEYISEKEFCDYLNCLIPAIEEMRKSSYGAPSYFELLVVLAFTIFVDKKVDYAIIETGLGGLFDATNVVSRPDKLVLLTPIGKDHTRILGSTLPLIASQKAGIIQEKNTVLSSDQPFSVQTVFNAHAHKKNTSIHFIRKNKEYQEEQVSLQQTLFTFSFLHVTISHVELGLLGAHQIQNCALALAALSTLSKRDGFIIQEPSLRTHLSKATFSGRLERIQTRNGTIILDGAHNPQKMRALIRALDTLYPATKLTFIVAFKTGKDIKQALYPLTKKAKHIYVTEFHTHPQDTITTCVPAPEIVSILHKLNFYDTSIVLNPTEALKPSQEEKTPIIVTGSLYLLAHLYPSIRPI